MMKPNMTSDALKILYQRYYANHPERQAALSKTRINDEVVRQLKRLQEQHQLSDADLAQLANTDESIVRQLEDGEYEGDALILLTRLATIFNLKVKIDLLPTTDYHSVT